MPDFMKDKADECREIRIGFFCVNRYYGEIE